MTPSDPLSNALSSFLDGDFGFSASVRLCVEGKKPSMRMEQCMSQTFYANEVLQTRQLSKNQAVAFRDTFVRPFTSMSLRIDSEYGLIAVGCVARLIMWWKDRLPVQEDPEKIEKLFLGDLWDILINNRWYPHTQPQHRSFKQILSEKYATHKPINVGHDNWLNLIKRSTDCMNSGGCDALFHLISFAMDRPDFRTSSLFKAFQMGGPLEKILKLYFDPLTVRRVVKVDDRGRDVRVQGDSPLCTMEEAVNSDASMIKVEWTDGRSDFLAPGCRQHRRHTREAAQRITVSLLQASSASDLHVLPKLTQSLDIVNPKAMTCVQLSLKCWVLLEAIMANPEAALEDSCEVYTNLSRKILIIALSKLVSSVHKEDVSDDIFAARLLDMALRSPQWWNKVIGPLNSEDQAAKQQVASDLLPTKDVCTHLKEYLASISEAVASLVLDSVYECMEHRLMPGQGDACSPVFEILCWVVEAAETKSRHKLLVSQPKHFWHFIGQHVLAMPDILSALFLQRTLRILANRTKVNVLAQVIRLTASPGCSLSCLSAFPPAPFPALATFLTLSICFLPTLALSITQIPSLALFIFLILLALSIRI